MSGSIVSFVSVIYCSIHGRGFNVRARLPDAAKSGVSGIMPFIICALTVRIQGLVLPMSDLSKAL